MDKVFPRKGLKDATVAVPIKPLFFESLFSRSRVSCVKCYKNFIFAGVGDVLCIYNLTSQKFEYRKQILRGQNIYGVAIFEKSTGFCDRIIIWGGQVLCQATIDIQNSIDLHDFQVWSDSVWIWDVSWVSPESFVSVGMNNSATLWNCKSISEERVSYCEEQCILYSGKIVGSTWENCVVIAGTVMQNILIWKPSDSVSSTIHSLEGHKGAVFSVNFCSTTNLLVSTSDDRSVRVWTVSFKMSDDWATADISLLSSIFGHTARVWKSVILKNSEFEAIVSIGEDGLLCVWTRDGKNLMRKEGHQGGSLSSVDADLGIGWIVTGGADGGLNQWSIQSRLDVKSKCIPFNYISSLSCDSVDKNDLNSKNKLLPKNGASKWPITNSKSLMEVPSSCAFSNSDSSISSIAPTVHDSTLVENSCSDFTLDANSLVSTNLKSIVLIKSGNIVASLDNGFLFGCHPVDLKWVPLFYDHRFVNYHLLGVSRSRSLVSLASICGTVLLFQDSSEGAAIKLVHILEVQISSSKIFSLNWLGDDYFITCVADGILKIWNVISLEGTLNVKECHEFILPSSKERWLTCSALFGPNLSCGDRTGSLHYFNLDKNSSLPQTFKRIHNGGVCDILWNASKEEAYSVGRDGYLRRWTVKDGQLELLLAEKLPIKWPTRIFLSHSLGIVVGGFTASHVSLWSYNERQILLTQECGGGHRSWDCSLEESFVLVWIKDKCVQFRSFPLQSFSSSVLIEGFHTKEINALVTCKGLSRDNKSSVFLFSGSEDTNMRISACLREDLFSRPRFAQQLVFRSHLSSIRALVTLPWIDEDSMNNLEAECMEAVSNRNSHLIVSAGGRAQLKVWCFTASHDQCDKMVELNSHMLRGDDRARKAEKYDSADPEARYMAMDVVCVPQNQIYIFTACSDGVVRIFHFDGNSKELSLETEIQYHEACILGILVKETFRSDAETQYTFLMLTMTTEGIVGVWKITVQPSVNSQTTKNYSIIHSSKPEFVFSAHQSGINSYALKCTENYCLLATGGDDTAIVLSRFKLDGNSIEDLFTFESAHEAQVSGLLFVEDSSWIFSTSTDQRIILWAYSCNPNLGLQYVCEYESVIADIHGLSIVDEKEVMLCVYGCGLEIIKIDLEKVSDWFHTSDKQTQLR